MIKCGFIDHHLDNIHAKLALQLLNRDLTGYDVRVVCAYESSPSGKVDWCNENGIKRYHLAEEVVEQSDVIWLLAPDQCDDHLSLGKSAYKSGKKVFVDKYLANKLSDARTIVSLCHSHGTALLSSSALRFAVELESVVRDIKSAPSAMYARGPGAWPGYACHTIAPVLRVLGSDIEKMINTGSPDVDVISLVYADGRSGLLELRYGDNIQQDFPWEFGIQSSGKLLHFKVVDGKGFFANLVRHVAHWFCTGESNITVDEMLQMVWILENGRTSLDAGRVWLTPP